MAAERGRGDNRLNQGPECFAILVHPRNGLADQRLVRKTRLPSQGIGEHLVGKTGEEQFGAVEKGLLKPLTPSIGVPSIISERASTSGSFF